MDQDLARELNRINAKLNKIVESQKKEHWAKVGFLVKLTGWNREEIRQAREQGLIEWKIDPIKGRMYKLESIPEIFIIRKNENKTTIGGGGLDGAGSIIHQKVSL